MSKKNLMLDVDAGAKSKPGDYEQLKPYTFVRLSYSADGAQYSGVGFSKVCHPDVWNSETGYEIARRKAVVHIVQQISGKVEKYALTN